MNKALKGLLVAMLAVSATVQAHTNKTFLLPRSHGVNLPMEMSTFSELIHRKSADKFGANFQAVGFFSRSTSEDSIGKYFGIKDKSTYTLARNAAASGGLGSTADADLGLFVHNNASAGGTSADVRFHPKHEAWGVRFDYFQDLEKILKGLYLSVAVPVVHVENNMELKVSSADAGEQANLTSFFNGTFDGTGGANVQKRLDHAIINGKDDSTGVADIDIRLGYNFLHEDTYCVGINIGFTIPTGDEADGVKLFEPIVGNGNHWAFGAGFHAGMRAWGDEDHNIKIKAALDYRYLFEASEKRTLGLIVDGKEIDNGHYVLLARVGDPKANGLTPAANVTTRNVDVTPGSRIDAVINLGYNNGGFCLNAGYNPFWKDTEEVKLKDKDFTGYGIALRTFDATAGANVAATDFVGAALTVDNLNKKSSETDSAVTHKIYAALGYVFKEWDCPLMLGIGGGYEFNDSNSAIEKYELWFKLGVGF